MKWRGFHRLPTEERLALVKAHANLDDKATATIAAASGLPATLSDSFIENSAGSFPVPLGFAVGFTIDGADVVVPMAVEESSVIAAACNGAKIAGAFETSATEPVMIGQIELRSAPADAAAILAKHKQTWMIHADAAIPSMVARGGGMRDIQLRELAPGHVVVHLLIDCRDAMGANLVNTVCEAMADEIAQAMGATVGLRILSNLADRRMAMASCRIPVAQLGEDVARAIVAANDFARLDSYRAATHNKGIMNGIDPVVLATGNDWRAVEAGAHAYAAHDGQYRGLTTYSITDGYLQANLTLPLALGTVGGVTAIHPVAKACLAVLGNPDARRLARICAAVGLAQNLAALRALASEGIQRGHMALHERNAKIRSNMEP